jgi:hypothetical protein
MVPSMREASPGEIVRITQDLGKVEELLEQPGEITVWATVRLLRKNGRVLVEVESEEGISRRVLKKVLRRCALELQRQP